jgi:hypothetical protein
MTNSEVILITMFAMALDRKVDRALDMANAKIEQSYEDN